ncbi:hypothetical protein A3Q56_05736 [Intoshia linei]|uniref:Uncharacterized protein n=1 Tax=Intoshia linei TaxID=1819745 RepID=A0A177AXE9_9BILA|nr:hypothetical protein A3Q56_05736 [Intoshia linei]
MTLTNIAIVLIVMFATVCGTGNFHFDFISYHNENGRDINGSYCDYLSKCDLYSTVEIQTVDTIYQWDNSMDKYLSDSNVLVDNHQFTYNITLKEIPKVVNIVIYIYDYDERDDDDLVDIIEINYYNYSHVDIYHKAHISNDAEYIFLKFKIYYIENKKKKENFHQSNSKDNKRELIDKLDIINKNKINSLNMMIDKNIPKHNVSNFIDNNDTLNVKNEIMLKKNKFQSQIINKIRKNYRNINITTQRNDRIELKLREKMSEQSKRFANDYKALTDMMFISFCIALIGCGGALILILYAKIKKWKTVEKMSNKPNKNIFYISKIIHGTLKGIVSSK